MEFNYVNLLIGNYSIMKIIIRSMQNGMVTQLGEKCGDLFTVAILVTLIKFVD